MVNEDKDNAFLQTIEEMLSKYFGLAKKYLGEKNAKLEMVLKIKKMQKVKEEMLALKEENEADMPAGEQ